jgi:MFS transporter, BCD family, chlorophyll transporter
MSADMNHRRPKLADMWTHVGTGLLPFADAATPDLPLGRILRLSLFQVTVGMALVLLNGTLNRVMIVEMGMPSWLVALMIALPVLAAPFRAVLGFRSDNHRSVLGWRRVPYIWMGSLLAFGGLAIMPFALILLSGDSNAPAFVGYASAALAFLLVGFGIHTVQTAGLALASDLAAPHNRHRIVALLYVMLLLGMVVSSLVFGVLLAEFSQVRLIQVIQGAAALTLWLNVIALWKQEPRDPSRNNVDAPQPSFRAQWQQFAGAGRARRLLVAVGLGTAAFNMQDILLEPYGGEILGLSVGATTLLTALTALGTLCGFALSARALGRDTDPARLAAYGLLCGLPAFVAVLLAAPLHSAMLFRCGAFLIGVGGGLFTVCTLTMAMQDAADDKAGGNGLALGAWGAVQATAGGVAIAVSGFLRDGIGALALSGKLGSALVGPVTGYAVVYQIELVLIFAALVAIGPLVRRTQTQTSQSASNFGLSELPG